MNTGLLLQTQSLLVLLLLIVGVIYRKNRKRHIKVMVSAIVWDLLLVLQIEFNRGVLTKAAGVSSNALALNIHVTIAFLTILSYIAVAYSGTRILKGMEGWRLRHRFLGLTALTLRILTFATSFMAAAIV